MPNGAPPKRGPSQTKGIQPKACLGSEAPFLSTSALQTEPDTSSGPREHRAPKPPYAPVYTAVPPLQSELTHHEPATAKNLRLPRPDSTPRRATTVLTRLLGAQRTRPR